MLRLRSLITGYLIVAVQGRNTEKFINLANSQHIPLWDVQRAAEGAYFKVELDHFFALRHLAKRTHCRLQIVRKVSSSATVLPDGGPFPAAVCSLWFYLLLLYLVC